LGINEYTLAEMVRIGILTKESRGVYRLSEAPQLSNPDLALVALRVPKGVICLISALHYYNLTTQIPYRVYVALPRDAKAPALEHPPVDVTYLTENAYLSGIEPQNIDGITVKIYSIEKTIADCFKFRNKIGQDVAIEALKDYLQKADRNLEKIIYFSKIDRVEKIIRPYIETLLS
jgi:predicted transcriptional regulator of viral defense system